MMKLRETKQIFLKVTAALLLLFGVFLLPLTAGKGRILFVETEVDLKQNGEAVVGYTVRWEVLSGELHGFYFQGNDRLKAAMVPDNSYAVDSSEREYKLDISYLGSGKWDIILANGQGVSRGTVTYVFYFTANFAAAGYLGLPLKRVLSSMLDAMAAEGYMEVVRESPLQVRVLSQPDLTALDPYERHFFNSLSDDGRLSQAELESLMNLIVKNIQKKAWDADVEATRKYYTRRIEDYIMDRQKSSRESIQSRDDNWYYWYYNSHRYYSRNYDFDRDPHRYETAIPVEVDHIIQGSVSSEIIRDLNVRHDACHNACHSACHSACVSGGLPLARGLSGRLLIIPKKKPGNYTSTESSKPKIAGHLLLARRNNMLPRALKK
jgi:hypothetical protein